MNLLCTLQPKQWFMDKAKLLRKFIYILQNIIKNMVTPVMRQNLENRLEFSPLLQTPESREIALTLYLSKSPVTLSTLAEAYKSVSRDEQFSNENTVAILLDFDARGMVNHHIDETTFELTPEYHNMMKDLVE